MDLSLIYPVDPKQLPKELGGVQWPPENFSVWTALAHESTMNCGAFYSDPATATDVITPLSLWREKTPPQKPVGTTKKQRKDSKKKTAHQRC